MIRIFLKVSCTTLKFYVISCICNTFPSMNCHVLYYWLQYVFRNVGKNIGYGFFQLFQVLWFPAINLFLGLPPHKNITRWSVLQEDHSWTPCLPIYHPVKWSCSHVKTSFARWACTIYCMKWNVAMCSTERLSATALKHFEVLYRIHCALQKARFNMCGCCDTAFSAQWSG
jgi:hypothetical protein